MSKALIEISTKLVIKIKNVKLEKKTAIKKVNQSVENAQQADVPYDRRKLSYANTFTNPFNGTQ